MHKQEKEISALRLNETVKSSASGGCSERGECAKGEALCDEARIRAAFVGTGGRLGEEHVVREARMRFRH